MFLTLLVEAVLGGTVETLASAGIEKTPQLAKRIQRAMDLVERHKPSAVEAAIQAAVESARVDVLDAFADDVYSGDADAVTRDMIALLNHPPFAEEVARKIIYRGQPDFEQLRLAYLNLPETQDDGRWAALEFPLLDFFDAIERHLQGDERVGPLLRDLQQIVTLSRIETTSQIVADASVQIQVSLAHLEKSGAQTAGGIQQLIALSHEQNATLRDVALFLRENVGRSVHTKGGAYIEGSADIKGDFVNRDKIIHITQVYLSGPGHPQLGENEFADAVIRYLDWVQKRYGHLNLRGIAAREKSALNLTLEDVYVSLLAEVTPQRRMRRTMQRRMDRVSGKNSVEAEAIDEVAQPRIVDMRELLTLSDRLAIIGGPGSGKTTFLHIIATSIAQALSSGDGQAVAHHLGLSGEFPLPIFLALSDYNRYRKSCQDAQDPRQGTLTAYISHSLIRQEAGLGELPSDFFERLLRAGKRCILLLDGLDEVADEDDRKVVRQDIENLAANPGVGQLLVTSRSRAYTEQSVLGQDFRVAEVQPMSLEQVDSLVERWCRAAYDETRADNESANLQSAIANLERIRKRRGEDPLINSPLMVAIVAIVHDEDRRLPDERADLYRRCVKVLLAETYKPATDAQVERGKRGGNDKEKRTLLTYLAFCMMSAGEEKGRAVEESQISAWLRPQFVKLQGEERADAGLAEFLATLAERGSLLDERNRRYQFIHLTFQEFLCAAYLVDTLRENAKIVRLLFEDGRLSQSWWRETVLLTVGYMGLGSIDAPLALVQALVEQQAESSVVVGAVEVATMAFLEQNGQDAATVDLLRKRLVTLIIDKEHPGSPEQRLAAGKALSRLGDPRPGVGVRADGLPDIDWVKIPEVDAQGRRDFLYGEKGERRSEPSFWMARYLVTYAQFQAFVDADDGQRDKRWYKGLDRTQNRPYEQSFKHLNHPRENVTWYQAMAFCRWLTEKAKTEPAVLPPDARSGAWRITLPTEWQWEKAARGHDGRIYPWGNKYISGYANVDETEKKDGPHYLQQTSAVGLYPQGISPYGILDLSGNVWEWCLNESRKPERFQEEGNEVRVLRGGAWNWEAYRAKASSRSDDRGAWLNNYGFRCVVVPIK